MTDTAEDTATEVITIPHKDDVPALFKKKDGIKQLVDTIVKQVQSQHIDHSTEAGRKELKALARKVTRSKTLIDEVRKDVNAEAQAVIKANNEIGKDAIERLAALAEETKKPVTEWEAAEAERVRQHLLRMDEFDQGRVDAHSDVATIKGIIEYVTAIVVDEKWEEYEADAKTAKAQALDKWAADLAIAQQREDAASELEQLRAEAAARAEADEAAAVAEAQRQAEEALARQKAADEAATKERADAQAKEAAEAAEKKAEADRMETEKRHARELVEAEQRAEQAAQAERDRIAADKAAEDELRAARAANKKHRQKIRAEVVASIVAVGAANYEEIVDAMMAGEIAHVEVKL